ncbi:MAG: HNH endonuclease [Myxococcota bacterium]
MRTLVLDQGYEPHQVVSWKRAIGLLYVGKADVLEEYDAVVRSVSLAMPMPAVVRLKARAPQKAHRIRFSRRNVLLRDGHRCQYCGAQKPAKELTYDHVLPRSKGGRTTWTNIVAACRPCNAQKGNRTPEQARMPLRRKPVKPSWLPGGPARAGLPEVIPDRWETWVAWALPKRSA